MAKYLKASQKPSSNSSPAVDVPSIVKGVIDDIRVNGDDAVRKYSEKFDSWSPESFKLSSTQINQLIAQVPEQVIKDIKEAQDNIRRFAEAQRDSLREFELEIQPGVFLGQRNNPVQRVGW
jgi:histidinol dehydrogenase